jgi:ubiquitin-protein ligase
VVEKSMIGFDCAGCGRHFEVPDHFAGKKAHCRKCGGGMVVPAARAGASSAVSVAAVASLTGTAKLPVRARRLIADLEQMRGAFGGGTMIRLADGKGEAGEVYRIGYAVRGIEKLASKRPVFRDEHAVEIRMTRDYPRLAPACRMLTPIFHPNIDESSICVGDHWTAGERLTDLVIRIGEMIAYQAYNIKSPLNGEAAMWADLNPEQLPTDGRNLHPSPLGQAG